MNADSLKYKIKIKSLQTGVFSQDLLQMYFFERLLYRISVSKYKYNFILKGGLLLSIMIGDTRRTTQDMDMMIKNICLEKKIIIKIIKEIINLEVNDGIIFTFSKVQDIRLLDKYNGYKISLIGKKENICVVLHIDITTGDPIVPKELLLSYTSLFDEVNIEILAFSKETIIAEKFETFLDSNVNNTRMKDYYDMYVLLKLYKHEINANNLFMAIKETCLRRNTYELLNQAREIFENIKVSEYILKQWDKFQKKYIFAREISYTDIMNTIKFIVELVELNT